MADSRKNSWAGKLKWVGRASRRGLIALGVVLAVLAFGRAVLPSILLRAVNQRLARIPDYQGHVADVHVALWRGAYALRDVSVVKTEGGVPEPFFNARSIEFSLAWRELFHRRIVSDIHVDGARLNFVKAPVAAASQLPVDRRWQEAIQDIFPIEINYFEITDGRLRYVDRTRKPELNIFVNDLRAVATGLRNRREESGEELPARLTLEGETVGNGRLVISGAGEPLADQPHFELRVTLQGVSLPALNDLLRSFARVDVAAGKFQLYFEMAAKDGRFQGYAKTFFSHVDFNIVADPNKNILEKAWEMLVSGLMTVLKNKQHDELAMRVPFAGEFGQTKVGVWATIVSMLRNGFIEALPPVLERTIKSAAIPPPSKPIAPPSAPAAPLSPPATKR